MSIILTVALLIAAIPNHGDAAPIAAGEACPAVHLKKGVDQSANVPWFNKVTFASIEKTLLTGEIAKIEDLKEALSNSGKKPSGTTAGLALITFTDGTQAVWKPGQWNTAEVGAYRLARAVGSRLIPPTVARTIDGTLGSLQYFVRTKLDLTKMDWKARNELWDRVPNWQKSQRDIFNFVFGNWDLHWGNILIDDSDSIVQIDNGVIRGRMMVRYGELPWVRKLSYSTEAKLSERLGPFPFDNFVHLDKPSIDQFAELVRSKADPKDLANFVNIRTKNKVEDMTMNVAFWDNGIWIQSIGYSNFKPIIPQTFSKKVIDSYRALTFDNMKALLPPGVFQDKVILEMLGRRDQIVRAAERRGMTP